MFREQVVGFMQICTNVKKVLGCSSKGFDTMSQHFMWVERLNEQIVSKRMGRMRLRDHRSIE